MLVQIVVRYRFKAELNEDEPNERKRDFKLYKGVAGELPTVVLHKKN